MSVLVRKSIFQMERLKTWWSEYVYLKRLKYDRSLHSYKNKKRNKILLMANGISHTFWHLLDDATFDIQD